MWKKSKFRGTIHHYIKEYTITYYFVFFKYMNLKSLTFMELILSSDHSPATLNVHILGQFVLAKIYFLLRQAVQRAHESRWVSLLDGPASVFLWSFTVLHLSPGTTSGRGDMNASHVCAVGFLQCATMIFLWMSAGLLQYLGAIMRSERPTLD